MANIPNITGQVTGKRKILNGVVQSILTYGALVWQKVTRVKKYNAMLIRVQTRKLLMVTIPY